MSHPHIAGLVYPSGRRIYIGATPERGEFHATPRKACKWPDEQAALDAIAALKSFFKLRSPELLKHFTTPV